MKWLIRRLSRWLHKEIQKRHAILIPLRLFIGLGWLRSSVEKLLDPNWYSGDALHQYFYERIAEGDVAFPFYQSLMEGLFSAHAPMLGNLVMLGQLCCGLALLFGVLTRPALLVGLFMNLNFILAGSVNPSAFYIAIQLTLLPSGVGQVFGFDSFLLFTNPFIATPKKQWWMERVKTFLYLGCSLACGVLAIPIASRVKTVDPAHSIEDPAMLLLILLAMQGLLLLILCGRAAQRERYLQEGQKRAARRKTSQPFVRQHPIPEYAAQSSTGGLVQVERAQNNDDKHERASKLNLSARFIYFAPNHRPKEGCRCTASRRADHQIAA